MVNKCDRCGERYSPSRQTTDYVHQCSSGDTTTDQEDVLIVGQWTDYSGSGGVGPNHTMIAGATNELQGTEAALEGAKFTGVTDRGKKKQLYRQRQHYEYQKVQ